MKILNQKSSENLKQNLIFGFRFSVLPAFSLVELMVVIAIIATVSLSSVVGFARLRDVLLLREASTFILDLVKQQELKILRGDFEKSTITFLNDYMVVEEFIEGATLDLSLFDNCPAGKPGKYGVSIKNDGQLVQSSPDGVIQTRQLSVNTNDCETDIAGATYRELIYQLINGDQYSNRIRFVHFNLNREPNDADKKRVNNTIEISSGATTRVEISPPYGKKIIYNQQGLVKPSWNIILRDKNTESEETITLK